MSLSLSLSLSSSLYLPLSIFLVMSYLLITLNKCLKGQKSLGLLCQCCEDSDCQWCRTDQASKQGTRSPIELFWTAKNRKMKEPKNQENERQREEAKVLETEREKRFWLQRFTFCWLPKRINREAERESQFFGFSRSHFVWLPIKSGSQKRGKMRHEKKPEKMREPKRIKKWKGRDSFFVKFLLAFFHPCPLSFCSLSLCWMFLSPQIQSQALYIFCCKLQLVTITRITRFTMIISFTRITSSTRIPKIYISPESPDSPE